MFIQGVYWNHGIGDSDDSMTLLEYLADRAVPSLTDEEIFHDLHLDDLDGDLRSHAPIPVPLHDDPSDPDTPFIRDIWFAIDVILDVAALEIQCREEGSFSLNELYLGDLEPECPTMTIVATEEGLRRIRQAMEDFIHHPEAYDLRNMLMGDYYEDLVDTARTLYLDLFLPGAEGPGGEA